MSFHRLKAAVLDLKQRTVRLLPRLNHTSTSLWIAIQVAALTLQKDPLTKNHQVLRGFSTLNGR